MQTNSSEPKALSTEPGRARFRFASLIGKVYRQWRREVDLCFRDLGLSDATRLPLLALYIAERPLRQKDLAATLHLDTSSLVRVLGQLEKAQMVTATPEPDDRRTKRIELTDLGRQNAALILNKSLELEQAILSEVSATDLQTTRRVLEVISRHLDHRSGSG